VLTCERRRPALPHDAPTGELLAGLARRRPPPPCGSERPLLASYSGKPLALEDPSKKILGGCSRHGTRPPPPPPPPPPRSSCGRQALQQQREEGRGRGLPDATESPPAGSLFQGENVCVCLCQRGCLLPFPRPNPSDPSITARRPSHQMSTHHTISLSVVAFPPTPHSLTRTFRRQKVHGSFALALLTAGCYSKAFGFGVLPPSQATVTTTPDSTPTPCY
jgi:hypothetical protein